MEFAGIQCDTTSQVVDVIVQNWIGFTEAQIVEYVTHIGVQNAVDEIIGGYGLNVSIDNAPSHMNSCGYDREDLIEALGQYVADIA